MIAKKLFHFVTNPFCEEEGKPSFGRIASAFIVAFALGWVTHLVHHNHALPDFTGLTFFIVAIYGINKAADVAQKITAKLSGDKPEPPPCN